MLIEINPLMFYPSFLPILSDLRWFLSVRLPSFWWWCTHHGPTTGETSWVLRLACCSSSWVSSPALQDSGLSGQCLSQNALLRHYSVWKSESGDTGSLVSVSVVMWQSCELLCMGIMWCSGPHVSYADGHMTCSLTQCWFITALRHPGSLPGLCAATGVRCEEVTVLSNYRWVTSADSTGWHGPAVVCDSHVTAIMWQSCDGNHVTVMW